MLKEAENKQGGAGCEGCPLLRREKLRGRHFSPKEWLRECAGQVIEPSKEPEEPPEPEELAAAEDEAEGRAAYQAANAVYGDAYRQLSDAFSRQADGPTRTEAQQAVTAAKADVDRAAEELRVAAGRLNALRQARSRRNALARQQQAAAPKAGPTKAGEGRDAFLARMQASGERSGLAAIRDKVTSVLKSA